MIAVELFVVLLFIFLGARIGGIGIGFAGGAGVIALSLILGVPTSQSFIPVDVILIIMSVITAIAAMQVAGGMDWLVQIAENFLRKHPERITFYAPIVTFVMTLMAGTGHTAFSTLPVIAEVAKGQGVRPSRPLSIAVVASQIAITASPISAAVVAFAAMLAPFGVDYLTLLMVCIPTTFIACMVGAVVANYMGSELKDDPIYQERLEKGLIKLATEEKREILPTAKKATYIFLAAIGFVVCYAAAISSSVGLIENPALGRNEAIMSVMLAAAAAIATLSPSSCVCAVASTVISPVAHTTEAPPPVVVDVAGVKTLIVIALGPTARTLCVLLISPVGTPPVAVAPDKAYESPSWYEVAPTSVTTTSTDPLTTERGLEASVA